MKPEYKARWVEALRSGKYQQGKGRLNGEGKFCCLGVLCDVVKDEVGGSWRDNFQPDGDAGTINMPFFVCPSHDGSWENSASAYPPFEVRNLTGLEFQNPMVKVPAGKLLVEPYADTLSSLNDSGDYSFEEIADIIEAQL